MQAGSFEREVESWLRSFRSWLQSHERFTWITLLFALSPSPVGALIALALGVLQLNLVARHRIPSSERAMLMLATVLAVANFALAVVILTLLARRGLSIWQLWNPMWWPRWLLGVFGIGDIPQVQNVLHHMIEAEALHG